jgi:choloylglycine hydrolase
MDWLETPQPQFWVLPKGMKRKAMATPQHGEEFSWESKYSSIIVSALETKKPKTDRYMRATSDGLNSEGLTANLLWLKRSSYPKQNDGEIAGKKPMSLSIWTQYILDVCKDVNEAIVAMKNIYIQTSEIASGERSGSMGACHLSVGDRDGNSAIFEYIEGVLHIYTNIIEDHKQHIDFSLLFNLQISGHLEFEARLNVLYKFEGGFIKYYTKEQMQVMTNDPEFNRQVGSLVYWDELNDRYETYENPAILPGSNLSLSRFIRASYFTKEMKLIEKEDSVKQTSSLILARLAGVMNNAAQPATRKRGAEKASEDLSRTQYNSYAAQTELQYFYRSGYSPFMIWVHLADFDTKLEKLPEGKVYQLHLDELGVFKKKDAYVSGNVATYFEIEDMFPFIPVD